MAVDTLDPTWINAPGGVGPSYDSEELRRNQGFTIARGATPGSARAGILAVGDLALSLSGLNVRLGAGGCVVATAKGAYITGFAAVTTVGALAAADVTNPRRDRVVIEILDPDNGGGAGRKGQARVITGTPNVSAATGGGYPPEPSGPVLTIGYVDVPKSGGGNPVVTLTAPYTAAAGAPVPVRDATEMNALPKRSDALCQRLDLGGVIYTCTGSAWVAPMRMDVGQGAAVPVHKAGNTVITSGQFGDFTLTLPAAFPNTMVAALLNDISPITNNDWPLVFKPRWDLCDRTKVVGRAYRANTGVGVQGNFNVSWSADGY